MRNRLRLLNYYITTLDAGSTIDSSATSGSFNVVNKTVDGQTLVDGEYTFWVTIGYGTSESEDFRIWKVSNKTLYYDYRPGAKSTHIPGDAVQINTNARNINYLSENVDDIGGVDIQSGLNVLVKGGKFYNGAEVVDINDTVFIMTDNINHNYVIFDFNTDTLKVVTDTTGLSFYPFATVTTVGGSVTRIVDERSYFSKGPDGSPGAPGPVGPQGIPGAIAVAPPGESQTINDNILPGGSTSVATDNSTYIRVTESNSSSTDYTLTSISRYDPNGNLLSSQVITGVFGTDSIIYAAITGAVNKITGVFNFDGQPAYTNIQNLFTAPQMFGDTAAFLSLVLFPYYLNITNSSVFDASNGSKQKFEFTDSGSHTLSFSGLRAGGNYVFAISVTGGSATLEKATSFTDCDTITAMYAIVGATTDPSPYPLTLGIGIHIFVAEAFSTGIHVSKIGASVPA